MGQRLVTCWFQNMAVKCTVCHGSLCVMLESAKENSKQAFAGNREGFPYAPKEVPNAT